MKPITFIMLLLVACLGILADASGQDTIFFTKGDTLLVQVVEVRQAVVTYKKQSNPKGPLYTTSKGSIIKITYENGEEDVFQSAPAAPSLVLHPPQRTSALLHPSQSSSSQGQKSINATYGFGGTMFCLSAAMLGGLSYDNDSPSDRNDEANEVFFTLSGVFAFAGAVAVLAAYSSERQLKKGSRRRVQGGVHGTGWRFQAGEHGVGVAYGW